MIDNHGIGDFLLNAGLVVAAFAALASAVGRFRQDGRLMLAGERAALALTAMMASASLLLIHAFVTHDYVNKYVEHYSDNNMPWYYLIASFWGGQAGSLMFWVLILSIATGLVIWQNREKNRDLLPTVITVLMVLQLFFISLMIFEANPFETFRISEPPINGRGLEPLLQNPAMTFHPPSILNGYIWFSIPFAFAVASLIHRRLDDGWIRTTRRYAMVSWAFLSIGNLFGGMWAYEELGWGGFWGWDPVENASLMPWFGATAYLHSVMIQERRGMLKVWNLYLVLLTFFLTIFGTFLTRSGLISSVHTFAQSDVGIYFLIFMPVLLVFSFTLLNWRILDGSLRDVTDGTRKGEKSVKNPLFKAFLLAVAVPVVLAAGFYAYNPELKKSIIVLTILLAWVVSVVVSYGSRLGWEKAGGMRERKRIDYLMSREGVFLLNNFVLIGCVGVIMFGTIGEKISQFFWQETKYPPTWFNTWMVPGGVLLLLLMSIGPLIPWRKATWKSFRKNMAVPMLVAGTATFCVWFFDVYHMQQRIADTNIPFGQVPLGRLPLVAELSGIYALFGFYGVFFVTYTLVLEMVRGTLIRARNSKQGYLKSFVRLMAKGKRRYGGYLTHLGFAGLFLGFIGTGLKTEQDLSFSGIGSSHMLEDKQLTFLGFEEENNREYTEFFAKFRVDQVDENGAVVEELGVLHPSRRAYKGANIKMSRVTTEKDEIFLWRGNVYLALVSFKPGYNQAEIMAHYNPMLLWMWFGGGFLILGVLVSVWPEPRRYVVYSAARRAPKVKTSSLEPAVAATQARTAQES